MRTAFWLSIALAVLLAGPALAREGDQPSQKKVPAPAEQARPVGQTEPAPLMVAREAGPKIEFQIGADFFGGGMAGLDFIGGVNATFVYPVLDMLWVGIRPGLHYALVENSPYDETWMHADAIVQLNVLRDPVRLYVLASGGYSFALDTDHYNDLAHGYSAAGGLGVAWKPADANLGLFCELVFRYGAAVKQSSRLVLDQDGHPIYEPDTLTWQSETYDRKFELTAFTFNVGLTVSP